MRRSTAILVAALTTSASLGIYIQQGLSSRVASTLATSESAMTVVSIAASVAIAAGYVLAPAAAAYASSTKRLLVASLCGLVITAGPLLEAFQGSMAAFVCGRIMMGFSSGAALALTSQFGLALVGHGNERSAVLATMVGVLAAFALLVPVSAFVAEHYDWIWSFRILAALATATLAAVALTEAPEERRPPTKWLFAAPPRLVWWHIWSNAMVFAAAFTIVSELDRFVASIGLPSSMTFASSLSIGAGCAGGLLISLALSRFEGRQTEHVARLLGWFAASLACLAGVVFTHAPPAAAVLAALAVMAALFFALSVELQAEIACQSYLPGVALGINSACGFLGQGVGAGIGAVSRSMPSGGAAAAIAATTIAIVAAVHAHKLTLGKPR